MPRSKTIGKPRKRNRQTTKNSHTSPLEIERLNKIAEALRLRQKGYSFADMAAYFDVNVSTAHDWVRKGMAGIIEEPARAVLQMELSRLDIMQSGVYEHAAGGDIPAIDAMLRIMQMRARYLGLFPDKAALGLRIEAGAISSEGPQAVAMQIEFITPSRRYDDEVSPPMSGGNGNGR
jgi:hypothetical protein